MALEDILAQAGDGQDFIVELPVGNSAYRPADILVETDGSLLCVETPLITPGGGGNIFVICD